MAETKITLYRKGSVPDRFGCTNFGGITSDGDTVYCIKAAQAENMAAIYKYKAFDQPLASVKSFKGLGHANGITYAGGFLYVPVWSKRLITKKNAIARINFAKGTTELITGKAKSFSCIAHYSGDQFIVGSGGSSFQLIKILGNTYTVLKSFKVANPKKAAGYTTSQDIYYSAGSLYIPMVKSNLRQSVVLIVSLSGGIVGGRTYTPSKIWTNGISKGKLEIESLTIDKSGRVLFGCNADRDGIFRKVK